jgi:hypothetical protein
MTGPDHYHKAEKPTKKAHEHLLGFQHVMFQLPGDPDVLESPDAGHPDRQLWQPLIALSLYDHPLALRLHGNPILRVWAWYRIEPRRRIEKLFPVERTPHGETDIERLLIGAFDLDLDPPTLRRFLKELSPLLTAALSTQAEKKTGKTREKAADQLRRYAKHFLTASDAHREAELSTQQHADAVLHYVIALENLLAVVC